MKTIYLEDEFNSIGPDTERSVAVYTPEMMGVKVKFLRETTLPDVHAHPHQQITYIISGNFTFWVDEEEIFVQSGNILLIEPNKNHGCICLSDGGELLDVFAPMREDFLDEAKK